MQGLSIKKRILQHADEAGLVGTIDRALSAGVSRAQHGPVALGHLRSQEGLLYFCASAIVRDLRVRF